MRPALAPVLVVALTLASRAAPSARQLPGAAASSEKLARAARLEAETVRVDGLLDEPAWRRAEALTDFAQKEPVEGTAPSQPMEVRFLYDSTALYVGFKLSSDPASPIQAPLGRRDAADQAEHVSVSLDTYHDRRTAYTFGVTASGVRLDWFHPEDREDVFDEGFEPVWEARTNVGATGWTAEFWIPFSQLRFNDAPTQSWGLNVRRFTPTLEEQDYWVLIPRTVTAWASRFGTLAGLDGVRPGRGVELLPYISGAADYAAVTDVRNPFESARNFGGRTGMDMKVGIGSSLTLDATFNPDFGQVEADPAEVNLTAFETVFPEKRPFFTEGSRLMNLALSGGLNLFNSRRIGARPGGPASGRYVDYPETTTILAAAKLTGRTVRGTSIGMLGAIGDHESARAFTEDAGGIRRIQVAPRTSYGLARVQQEIGRSGSTMSLMGTAVSRRMAPGDTLASVLPSRALGIGGDAVLRFKGGEYEATMLGMASFVSGAPAAIERLQRTAAHYFQRPDRISARIDPSKRSLRGFKTITGIERKSGRHWLWDTTVTVLSPGLETNDIGRTISGDALRHGANLRYRETRPGRRFRAATLAVAVNNEWDFDRDLVGRSVRPSINLTLTNFWTASASVARNFHVVDLALTRGGPLMQRPSGWTTTLNLSNRSTAQTRWSGAATLSSNEDGGHVHRLSALFSFRPGPRWQLSVEPNVDHTVDVQQFVGTFSGGRPETYGQRYVFSSIQRTTLSSQIRMGLTLRPDLNIDVYSEPFAATGRYYGFGELLRSRTRDRLLYGTGSTTIDRDSGSGWIVDDAGAGFRFADPDFSVRSLRSNVVLRWEWRPGSTLYVVWQQAREERTTIGSPPASFNDLLSSFTAPGRTFLAVKTSFWLPVR